MPDARRHVAVTFAIDTTEVAAFQWAAMRVVGPRRFEMIVDQDSNWELEPPS
jgi:hypothetical protein